MPFLLALSATALFAAFLALFPAAVGYVQAKFNVSTRIRLALVMPALWVLVEWVRGMIFTGFPWLTFGYSQASASPLVGYAPLLGGVWCVIGCGSERGFVFIGMAGAMEQAGQKSCWRYLLCCGFWG